MVLLGVGAIFGVAYHLFSDTGVLAANVSSSYRGIDASGTRELKEIGLDEVYSYIEEGAIIIDARRRYDYDAGHLPGAILIPVDSMATHVEMLLGSIDREQKILVYCQSDLCEFDTFVASRIQSLGFSNVAVFSGGWEEWDDAQGNGR